MNLLCMHKIFLDFILITDRYQLLFFQKKSLQSGYQLFNIGTLDFKKLKKLFQSFEILTKTSTFKLKSDNIKTKMLVKPTKTLKTKTNSNKSKTSKRRSVLV